MKCELGFGFLDLAFLVKIGFSEPLMQIKRRPRGIENDPALGNAQIGIDPKF